jgi:hypothetical protein
MFRFVTALLNRHARRRTAPKVRLTLDAQEARDVPTTISLTWHAAGPQPEPPTRVVYTPELPADEYINPDLGL